MTHGSSKSLTAEQLVSIGHDLPLLGKLGLTRGSADVHWSLGLCSRESIPLVACSAIRLAVVTVQVG